MAIRAERERHGWSQEKLAARSGLDRTYVSGVERGERSPNLRNLIRMSEGLEVSLSSLVLTAEAGLSGR